MLKDPGGWEYVKIEDSDAGIQTEHTCFDGTPHPDVCSGTLTLSSGNTFVQKVTVHHQSVARHGTYELAGDQLADLVRQFWENPEIVAIATSGATIDLHVWQREPESGDDDGLDTFVTPLCREIESALRAAAPEQSTVVREMAPHRKAAARNSRVLDVVVVEPGEWWIGYHKAVKTAERWPGGAIPVRLPSHAVSRAYAKLEEAIQWSSFPLSAGDECVEVGCAPGGASQALLERGLQRDFDFEKRWPEVLGTLLET